MHTHVSFRYIHITHTHRGGHGSIDVCTAYIHAHIHTCIHTYVLHVHVTNTHTYIHTCIHAYIHMCYICTCDKHSLGTHGSIDVYTYVHKYMHTYVCITYIHMTHTHRGGHGFVDVISPL